MDGRSQPTTIVWSNGSREITVVNLSEPVAAGTERDVYETMRMLLQRCTAITMSARGSGRAADCCPTLAGAGPGFAGNVKANLHVEQTFDAGRVRQTVVIRGYTGRPFDAYTARLLFQ